MSKKAGEPREIDLCQEGKVRLRLSDSGHLFLMEWKPSKPLTQEEEPELSVSRGDDIRQTYIVHLNGRPDVLRKWLKQKYDISQLRDLCQDLAARLKDNKFKFDALGGENLYKAGYLADLLIRHNKLPDFFGYLSEEDQDLLESLETIIRLSLDRDNFKRNRRNR